MTISATALAVTLITVAVFTLLGLLQASRQAISLEDYMVSRNRVGHWHGPGYHCGLGHGGLDFVQSARGGGPPAALPALSVTALARLPPAALFAFMGTRVRFFDAQGPFPQ